MSGRGFSVLLLCSFALTATALRCWKCENHDLQGCKTFGSIENCRRGDRETCQTEVRYFEHKKVIIRTGCKQGTACLSNNIQNPGAAWTPSQCNDGSRNSVCRCCCTGSLCNKKNQNLMCEFPIVKDVPAPASKEPPMEKTCGEYPDEPINGERFCIGGYGLRAFCKFTCDDGYRMIGYDMTVCVHRGRGLVWNRDAPFCEREDLCKPIPAKPVNGRVKCDGDGQVGTECKFSCNYGYEMDGPPLTECVKTVSGTSWNHDTPKCRKISCSPMPDIPENGEINCEGIGELGDTCYFTCDHGYELAGPPDTTCTKLVGFDGAEWSHETPICKQLLCNYIPREPVNGVKECTGKRELGTVCSFACNIGYEINGPTSTTCEKTVFGMRWSHRVPRCTPVCKTLPEEPESGFKTCSGNGKLGTICTFDCNPGHEMRGPSATICQVQGAGADWSHGTPFCEPVCKPLPESPENGRMKCDNNGNVGTLCGFECNSGYKLVGEPQTICAKVIGGAAWTDEPPTCMPFCEPLPQEPVNGERLCDGSGEIGTQCTFECHPGFRRNGAPESICEMSSTRPDWTHETPECEPVCDGLPKAPVNGSVECQGSGEPGTVCKFSCNGYGYVLEGSDATTCQEGETHPEWSNEEPICTIRPVCSDLGNMPHGEIACDDPANVEGTTCSFQCLEVGFTLVPLEREEIKCRAIGSNLRWTARKPCCVDCSRAKRDIVIAMDSSGSINPREWREMQKFVQQLVRKFEVSEDAVQFSIFQFSSAPRSDGFMYFGRYSRPQLIKQVGRMRRIGSGTMTGRALSYAQRRLADKGNRGNIPDMLLVLTDGAAEDSDELWKVSREIREAGVEIIALAIGPTNDFVNQMTRMTGSRENVIMAARVSDLTNDLGDLLFKKTCQDERECLQYA